MGYAHVKFGSGSVEMDLPATDNPQVLGVGLPQGMHLPVVITVSANGSSTGIVCGVVEAGSSGTFPSDAPTILTSANK